MWLMISVFLKGLCGGVVDLTRLVCVKCGRVEYSTLPLPLCSFICDKCLVKHKRDNALSHELSFALSQEEEKEAKKK